MKKIYDYVVVGAGPAGAMSAKTAAENGLDVALLERKSDVSFIRRCCTGCWGLHDEFMGDNPLFDDTTKRLIFPRSGFSIKYDGPIRNIFGFHVTTPDGSRVRLGDVKKGLETGSEARVAVMVDKGYFIKSLVDECRTNGVKIFLNTNIVDVWNEPECVVVSDNKGNLYRGKFVLAADGVNSRIMRRLGLNKLRRWLGTYRDRAWDLEGVEFEEMEALIFCMGWECSISLAPHIEDGLYHVAAASYDWKTDLEAGMKKFMMSPAYAPWFKNAREGGHRTSCVSNIYSTLAVPFKNNVLIAGDAAWMQECAIQGALMMGWKAGHTVTLAVKHNRINKKGIQDYLDWYSKELYARYSGGGGAGADLSDFIGPEDLNYLASLVDRPLQGTLEFYTIYRTIGKAYADLLPRIQEERPDIMEKLMAMRSVHPEVGIAKRRRDGFLSVT